MIPPRQTNIEDKERRFYVCAPSSAYLALQREAIQRGTDLWTLGGSVLVSWMNAGCPDFASAQESDPIPAPSPSSSVADEKEPDR